MRLEVVDDGVWEVRVGEGAGESVVREFHPRRRVGSDAMVLEVDVEV